MASNVSTTTNKIKEIQKEVNDGFDINYLKKLKKRVETAIASYNDMEMKAKNKLILRKQLKNGIFLTMKENNLKKKEAVDTFNNNIDKIIQQINKHNDIKKDKKIIIINGIEYIILETEGENNILYYNSQLYGLKKDNIKVEELKIYEKDSNFQNIVKNLLNKISVYDIVSGGKRIASYKLKGNNKKKL